MTWVREISGPYTPHELEQRISRWWDKLKVPQRLARPKPGRPKFYLLDGPPYVNEIPHVGHIRTTTYKDVWVRFKLMQGFNVWLQPGFDCHGLPIETMVERELGITSKRQIEEMGIEKFCEACHSHAEDKLQEWLKLYKRLGAWRGWFRPYLTYKNYYIEAGWWTVKRLFERGMLVPGLRPTFWCPRCQTALAGIEVTDAYKDVRDPAIYVKFPIRGRGKEYVVIFTTTPWTLISNTAIAVHPNEYYVRVRVGDEVLILAEKRVETVLHDLCQLDYEVVERFLGKKLEGVRYEPVLDVPVQHQLKEEANAHQIILSIPVMAKERYEDFVTMEAGSGCVHTAPGHGPEDHTVGEHYNLPVVSPIDDQGRFTAEAGAYAGLFVKDADKQVIEQLREGGFLLHFGWVVHAYPLCWRCKTPLVYRLTRQWFFKIGTIKERLIRGNENIVWLPGWGRERFHNWLIGATDWCISRQRYWGIPLPVWICKRCGTQQVIGGVKELKNKAVKKLPKRLDLHRHIVDQIEVRCATCDGWARRVPDTLDVWFDSGIAPWASLGYPSEKETFDRLWPANLICEGQDQFRGWFYSLAFCGMAAFNTYPYRSVGVTGWVLDAQGRKMSKSAGNVVWGRDAVEKLGADPLRLYYCWEVAPWETLKFSFETAQEVRRALNILWNCYAFFITYRGARFTARLTDLRIEDRWALSRINSLTAEVTEHLEKFEFHQAGRKLANFVVNDLSRFYIKLVRDRVWVTRRGRDKRAALSTLREVLTRLALLLAPITPHLSEEIWQNVNPGRSSVHLAPWPKPVKKWIDPDLEGVVHIARQVIDASWSARQLAGLRLRWPLRRMVVVTTDKRIVHTVKRSRPILLSLGNVRSVQVVGERPKGEFVGVETAWGHVLIDKQMDRQLWDEALIRELIRQVQALRKKRGYRVIEFIHLALASDPRTNELLRRHSALIKREVGASKLVVGGVMEAPVKFTFRGRWVNIAFVKAGK